MGVRSWLRGAGAWAREVLRAPVMPTGPSGWYGWSYGTPSAEADWGTFADFAFGGYGGNSVVFGLIRTRMSSFSEARFKYRVLADKRLFGDTSLRPLERPWPGATTGELLSRMELDVSLAGNTYVRRAGDRLERLRPDWVTIISEVEHDEMGREIRTVVGYLYEPHGDPDRGVEVYGVDEVAHWSPIPDPLANFRGMSWLTPVVREVEADNAMTTHRGAYFRNAASPNLILKYKQQLKQSHIDAIADQVNARHGGAENAFRTMVLDVGADPMIVGTALSDTTFSLVQAAGENRIAVASGVPAIVAGLKEGLAAGTHSNYEQAVRQMADMLLRPNWRGACAALAKLVDVPAGAELWFDTSDVALLQEGEASQAATFQVKAATASTLIQAGYEWQSVTVAIEAGDMTLLKHTGLVSVQMHSASQADKPDEATTRADAPTEGAVA